MKQVEKRISFHLCTPQTTLQQFRTQICVHRVLILISEQVVRVWLGLLCSTSLKLSTCFENKHLPHNCTVQCSYYFCFSWVPGLYIRLPSSLTVSIYWYHCLLVVSIVGRNQLICQMNKLFSYLPQISSQWVLFMISNCVIVANTVINQRTTKQRIIFKKIFLGPELLPCNLFLTIFKEYFKRNTKF